jgi:hypothetical protein
MNNQEQDKALENFRDGMHAWSATEYERLCIALRSHQKPRARARPFLFATAVVITALALQLVSVPTIKRPKPDSSDVEILDKLDQRLAESIPAPLEPLAFPVGGSGE